MSTMSLYSSDELDGAYTVVSGKTINESVTTSSSNNEYTQNFGYSLSWKNISYYTSCKDKDKTILSDVTGRAAAGEILGILGPSGCGKTTLLDILADRMKPDSYEGQVFVNGKRRKSCFRTLASYVAQVDSLMGCFSVYETLLFAASIALPAFSSIVDQRNRVENAICSMGLQSCRNTRVGDLFRKGLSGGQRRRLSIALELLSDPSILLLDEPTSGLDSAATQSIMNHIVALAARGRTIVLTIHQPSYSIWNMINTLMLMVRGRTVFFGPKHQALSYFQSINHPCPELCNPADFFLTLISTDFREHADVDLLIVSYQDSYLKRRADTVITEESSRLIGLVAEEPPIRVQYMRQIWSLVKRNIINNARNPGIYWVRLFMYICLSFVVGTMYLGGTSTGSIHSSDIVALLFYVQAFLVFMSVAVLPFFIEDRAVFLRERANWQLSSSAWVIANGISALPGIFVIALVSSIIVVHLVKLNSFGSFLLNLFLSLVVAESLMHVIGSLVSHYIVGIAAGAGLFGMFMLCEGFMINIASMPFYWKWGYYLGFHTYSFRSFMYSQFHGVNDAILREYGMEKVSVSSDMTVLIFYAFILQVIFFAIVSLKHTGRR